MYEKAGYFIQILYKRAGYMIHIKGIRLFLGDPNVRSDLSIPSYSCNEKMIHCFPQRRSGDGGMRPKQPYLPRSCIPPEEFQGEAWRKKFS